MLSGGRRRITWLLAFGAFFVGLLFWNQPLQSYAPSGDSFHPLKWFYEVPFRGSTATKMPYNAVIIYLVTARRTPEIVDSLQSVQVNLTTSAPWPIILMHTGDFDDSAKRDSLIGQVRERSNSQSFTDRVEFLRVNWTIPPEIPTDIDVLDPVFRHVYPGYHQMCAFYSYQIFDLPRFKDVTYYLRLDSDSLVNEKSCFDPFERMHNQNLSYAYKLVGQDPGFVVRGMWSLFDSYARKHPAVDAQLTKNQFRWPGSGDRDPHWFTDESDEPTWSYHNSFEVVKLDTFHRPDVREWLDELKSVPQRFFKYRWGDAPLRFATVNMFLDMDTEVGRFCDMPYYHQYTYEKCECQEDQRPPNRFMRRR